MHPRKILHHRGGLTASSSSSCVLSNRPCASSLCSLSPSHSLSHTEYFPSHSPVLIFLYALLFSFLIFYSHLKVIHHCDLPPRCKTTKREPSLLSLCVFLLHWSMRRALPAPLFHQTPHFSRRTAFYCGAKRLASDSLFQALPFLHAMIQRVSQEQYLRSNSRGNTFLMN